MGSVLMMCFFFWPDSTNVKFSANRCRTQASMPSTEPTKEHVAYMWLTVSNQQNGTRSGDDRVVKNNNFSFNCDHFLSLAKWCFCLIHQRGVLEKLLPCCWPNLTQKWKKQLPHVGVKLHVPWLKDIIMPATFYPSFEYCSVLKDELENYVCSNMETLRWENTQISCISLLLLVGAALNRTPLWVVVKDVNKQPIYLFG